MSTSKAVECSKLTATEKGGNDIELAECKKAVGYEEEVGKANLAPFQVSAPCEMEAGFEFVVDYEGQSFLVSVVSQGTCN
jgi:hypothetical protein